jgi:hypothetical protein
LPWLTIKECGTIALAVVFGKNEKDDLSAVDRHVIETIIGAYREELKSEFNRGRARNQ